jgi:hypothetical protein
MHPLVRLGAVRNERVATGEVALNKYYILMTGCPLWYSRPHTCRMLQKADRRSGSLDSPLKFFYSTLDLAM